jgi:hypothetical protein
VLFKHKTSDGKTVLLDTLVYARHGRELMGWKSPVGTPPSMLVSMPYIDDND